MLHRWWQSWAQGRKAGSTGSTESAVAVQEGVSPTVSTLSWRRLAWLGVLGLMLATVAAYAMLALNREAVRISHPGVVSAKDGVRSLDEAWSVASDAPQFPALAPGRMQALPDEWAASRPGYQGGVWYRFRFDHTPSGADPLQAVYIERACSNVEVHLNGELVWRGGRMSDPYTRNCYRTHLVPLPVSLLKPRENALDIKVVGYPVERVTARQRAGGLAAVRVGPLQEIRQLADQQTFWTSTIAQVLGGLLAVLGLFALGLAWVRKLGYLVHFGLLTLGWALMTGRLFPLDVPMPNAAQEVLIAMLFAPMAAFAVKFLLGYAGHGVRSGSPQQGGRVNAVLWAQCVLMPASLLLLGVDHLFLGARLWYVVFSLEIFAAIAYFLWEAGKGRRAEFWLMCVALGVVAAVLGIELSYQAGLLRLWGIHVTHFVMPLLYGAVAVRLIQVYARALQTAEGARQQLERRVHEISVEIERNFNQIAELRVEQIAEKERKRIASDLHDDLGAKLLTIVHTSDNDRISTLAREALEEMRLSVRGLTGRPMVLSDALADWRAEVVSRLGQAGIECEWRNPNEIVEEPLSSRTYVQTTRILREAVSNVIKHSAASHVVIAADVQLERREFLLVIQDNGKGIPLELDGRLDRGHGMTSMKHRAKQLSGQCLVESGPGFGTVIRLTLPLEMATLQQVRAAGMSMPGSAASMRSNAPPH
ncbi:histidine kinase [Aquabacterium olei]|uniref:histidine kinase n=1 Tax=Aquabacterium olei TaxID=1296669 RepID=A0A2U8FV07_9BURK|nr:ATP-binding protein [Aquabacterium olei]AWI54850.1 histidine kinase [Aquabacterium olei]